MGLGQRLDGHGSSAYVASETLATFLRKFQAFACDHERRRRPGWYRRVSATPAVGAMFPVTMLEMR
jgi:hypothetical protein